MFKIGLTGGIGSGKTRVADMLQEWGATLVDTDEIARALTAPGGAAMPAIEAEFGPSALTADGALNREWMRERAFSDPAARRRLEAVLHPIITEETLRQAEAARGSYLVFVVPLLVESLARWRSRVDRICVVDCDPDTQVARVQARSGLTEPAIRRIMAAQAARQTRLDMADDVITNDGATSPEQLRAQAKTLHDRWLALATTTGR
ncbi:dephospho-CoA kinase [Achromobacter piechaudii]|uniref:Dephospho-CoA kinase n=1 Tax=Achromobacter piechaudii TaxID=72556 RepID=A0A6S7DS69_9BURK|nr:dephospho-CoA kinase [Achromobacter piechaudii]CAB3654099.1 Dephospho-CoA kinase [Achromobacter piechaudii]CAB3816271.1 Dephospho-CoA kinase [Achromobacter piechaudii]CAB3853949.1 Dephospho-CoA kinase [Achromobacter piechaudii]CAB3945998.1 Dephospho-CoA kinase [Achromobacter piechaudii]